MRARPPRAAYAAALERMGARPGWMAKAAPLLVLVRRLSATPRSALR